MGDLLQESKIPGNPEIPELFPARKSLIMKFRIPGMGQGSLITSLAFFTVWIYGDFIFLFPLCSIDFIEDVLARGQEYRSTCRGQTFNGWLKCVLYALVIRLLRGLHNSCV
jgi:hypothetical protein